MLIHLDDPGLAPRTFSAEGDFLSAVQEHGRKYTFAMCRESGQRAWRPLGEMAWRNGSFRTFVNDACRKAGFEPPKLWNVRAGLDEYEDGVPIEDIVNLLKRSQ